MTDFLWPGTCVTCALMQVKWSGAPGLRDTQSQALQAGLPFLPLLS